MTVKVQQKVNFFQTFSQCGFIYIWPYLRIGTPDQGSFVNFTIKVQDFIDIITMHLVFFQIYMGVEKKIL